MTRIVKNDAWLRYIHDRFDGLSRNQASMKNGISYASAARFDRGDDTSTGHQLWLELCAGKPPFAQHERTHIEAVVAPRHKARSRATADGEIPRPGLIGPKNVHARRSIDDFEFFRKRYMGHLSRPWHVDAATKIATMYDEARRTRERRYVLMNVAPGTGKTTMLHDAGCWITCKHRDVRGANVSRGGQLSERNNARMRRSFERTVPDRAKPEDVLRKIAVDADACLPTDFGPFRPESRSDLWTRTQFIVLQDDGQAITEKEPTWSAYGLESGVIGNRFDLLFGDDLVDKNNISTEVTRRWTQDVWGDEFEKRLEPGGLIVVAGQRMHKRDLYWWLKELPAFEYVDDDSTTETRKYFHIVYPAHFEDRCEENHGLDAPPWPEGCLLDPVRAGWRDLKSEMAKPEVGIEKFNLIFQQDDTLQTGDELVLRDWIFKEPGALDKERTCWQLWEGTREGYSVITIDPSPTNYWGIIAWYYVPDGDNGLGGYRWVLNVEFRKMQGSDLLDFNYLQNEHYGVLEEYRQMFAQIGRPLRHVIIENNDGNRWLLGFQHAMDWRAKYGIEIHKHSTNINKPDPVRGVESLVGPQWRYGRVRLPYKTPSDRANVTPLINQVTAWPDEPNDLVMSHWFLEYNLPKLYIPPETTEVRPFRPSWLVSGTLVG